MSIQPNQHAQAGTDRPLADRQRRGRTHSGQGHAAENVIVFTIMFLMFLGGIYLMSFILDVHYFAFGIGLGLCLLAFFIPLLFDNSKALLKAKAVRNQDRNR